MDTTRTLPSGTVTFLFTDIEGSTRLWEQHPGVMGACVARQDALLIGCIQQQDGVLVKSRGEGDSLFAVFARATDAVAAAAALQQALQTEPWPLPSPPRGGVGGGVGPLRARGAPHERGRAASVGPTPSSSEPIRHNAG